MKNLKNEQAKEFEEKYGTDPDDIMMLSDEEYAHAYGVNPEDVSYDDSSLLDSEDDIIAVDEIKSRIKEIDDDLVALDELIADPKTDYVSKTDYNHEKTELFREKAILEGELIKIHSKHEERRGR